MATTRVISVTEELNHLLKQEDNASSLITRLLWDYYNSLNPKEEKKEDLIVIDPITIMDKNIKEQNLIDETEEINRLLGATDDED